MTDQPRSDNGTVVSILEIKRPTAKRLAMDILLHTDNLTPQGQREARASIPKVFFRGFRDLKQRLLDTLEYGVVPLADDKIEMKDVKWVSFKKDGPQIPPEGFRLVMERYTETPVFVSPEARNALKHFYQERQDLIDVEIEAMDELETIIGIKS